ncbi:hypothetical protein JMG10_09945 [Nostoc ellipsosporum NOK]|nr:hypothetical protein [Nostoc ellipsosporum NOK]
MKHLLALMLVFGAMFGLLGQQTAAAAAPVPIAAAPASTMSADCMEMMGGHQPQPAKKPCNGLTLDCIFAMGCAVPLMREPLAPVAQTVVPAPQLFWTTTTVLAGTDLAPEPHPPSLLG